MTLTLVLGVPAGLPPAPGGTPFPLSGLRELFTSGLAWGQDRPATPQQAHGSADRATAASVESTRAKRRFRPAGMPGR